MVTVDLDHRRNNVYPVIHIGIAKRNVNGNAAIKMNVKTSKKAISQKPKNISSPRGATEPMLPLFALPELTSFTIYYSLT
jgi:hypothetical protein